MGRLLKPAKVLVDTNVWLGYLLGREPACTAVKAMLRACCQCDVELFYAPTSLKDIFYLVPRILRRGEQGSQEVADLSFLSAAWASVRLVADLATAAPLCASECELAWMLRETHDDFEDNLIVAAAETCGADYLVTYDQGLLRHYAPASITPEALGELLAKVAP